MHRGHAPGIIKPAAAASAIVVGTAGVGTYQDPNQSSYTFAAPTFDGGGAGLLIALLWLPAFGNDANDMNGAHGFTLNGAAPDVIFANFMNNTDVDSKFLQATIGWWASPSAGDASGVIFDPANVGNMTGGGLFFANLSGLHASPVGALVRPNNVDGTAYPFDVTTTVANSLLIDINGDRNGTHTFTPDVAGGTAYTTAGPGSVDGSWHIRLRNGLAVNTYACGGDWSAAADPCCGMGLELKAA